MALPTGVAILAGWCAGLAAEIRDALGLDPIDEKLPGSECPACGLRLLRSLPAVRALR
ncbi:hypothetical protein O7626_03065 [Micromonospora sp. WMMD1102]|uniref:hypothetical protein n=1 Tax=Micromonospora sp. WMMD1102 TaxID=3016105 RepID=UPI002415028D|nr:hypothetical protein [Micromonospora sp. WMMD1102]MDG4784921.1 hypothetical protein [Micromonospora sp. WMMD1102]